MTGRTNYTPVNNSDAFGFDQVNALADHFDSVIGESVPAAANLPASGNWTGRQILAESEGIFYVWLSGNWRALAGYGNWAPTVPLSGAHLDGPDPLMYWWNGTLATLTGSMWVTGATWQVGWSICANLPADSGGVLVRPRKQHFITALSGTALLIIKITAAGVVTIDRLVSGATADWLIVNGSPWPTRPTP